MRCGVLWLFNDKFSEHLQWGMYCGILLPCWFDFSYADSVRRWKLLSCSIWKRYCMPCGNIRLYYYFDYICMHWAMLCWVLLPCWFDFSYADSVRRK